MLKRGREEGEASYLHGHGNRWCRGPLIGASGSGMVFTATLKTCSCSRRFMTDRLRPIMAVKSAEVSSSSSLLNEKMVLDDLQDCPYIRRIFGAETTAGGRGETFYNLLLEYPSGGTLEDLIKRSSGGLPENEVWHYTSCLLLGLEHLHGHGYVHRSLKPGKIILLGCGNCNDLMAKIGDYESVTTIETLKKTLWRRYSRMNLEYLSPEAFVDSKQGPASDIWALGCIVYEMITGKSIWEGKWNSEIKEELRKMKKGSGRMNILNGIVLSENARDFLNACFEIEVESRWTAERLLDLPFVL